MGGKGGREGGGEGDRECINNCNKVCFLSQNTLVRTIATKAPHVYVRSLALLSKRETSSPPGPRKQA